MALRTEPADPGCAACPSSAAVATPALASASGPRVNANHKLLDAWLLARCTTKLTVLKRVHVGAVRPGLLDELPHNDPGLAAELQYAPVVRRRNRVTLDGKGAWCLDTGGTDLDRDVLDVEVRSAASIPVRPARLIADGCGLSRGEARRLVEKVVPLPLSGGLRGVDLRAEAGVRGRYGGRLAAKGTTRLLR